MNCPEKTHLLMLQCESMVVINRALASEIHLPLCRRYRTNSALQQREHIKSVLDRHVEEHGCGRRILDPVPVPTVESTVAA
jgi:hypothetical protein